MLPYLQGTHGNPSSVQHESGRAAAAAIERARAEVAQLLRARPQEIVFTSGATESNNLAIKGFAASCETPGHIISCSTEHPAVIEPLKMLERSGWAVSWLAVDAAGQIDPEELNASFRADTAFVSLMAANNELGTIHDLETISALTHRHGAILHTDAAQAIGKLEFDVESLAVDLVSVSGHKLYGPQGVGALFLRRGALKRMRPLLHGGGQEGGLRSGTLNTPGIVGLGAACAIANTEIEEETGRLREKRDRLRNRLRELIPSMLENGPAEEGRLPGVLHVSFPGVDADAVMANCPEAAVSSGSACSAAAPGPSHVLTATGMSAELADASLRMSVGRFTTDQEVDRAAELIAKAVQRVSRLSKATQGMVAA